MKTKILTGICILFLLAGCGKEGIVGLFFPNFSNLWESSRDTRFQFTPTASSVGKSEGDFNGDEDGLKFKGKFNSYDIEFTFLEGPENTITYKGQFVKDSKPLQMIVRNKDGNQLTITKF